MRAPGDLVITVIDARMTSLSKNHDTLCRDF